MATISSFFLLPIRRLRAEPNQHILHYRSGRLVRRGAGLAYWFNPLSAAVAQVPVEDCETTFLLQERSSDFQEIKVQCTLTYRIVDAEKAAARFNFAISTRSGAWLEQPLERLANLWSQRALQPARSYLAGVTVTEALGSGADETRRRIHEALASDAELAAMGLALVSVLINRIAPTAEVEKALQTPTREAIQQRADEATFQRRALAVEKERAIKENELATEIELARRQEQLIQQQGANRLREVRQEAEAERLRVEGEAQRRSIETDGQARDIRTRARADADARTALDEVELRTERDRAGIWQHVPGNVLLGVALQQLADHLPQINQLNITPDFISQALQQALLGHEKKS